MSGLFKNLVQMFLSQAEKFSDREMLLYKNNGKYVPITWSECVNHVARVSLVLDRLGIQKGDKVCLLARNRPEWVYIDFAALSIGAAIVPIYLSTSTADISFITSNSNAKIAFVEDDVMAARLAELKNKKNINIKIIGLDGVHVDKVDHLLSDLLEKSRSSLHEWKVGLKDKTDAVQSTDLATLIYTSGTTGNPKGVKLSHENFLHNCSSVASVVPVRHNDLHLSFLPLSHVFERMAGYYFVLMMGGAIAYAESIETVGENLEEVSPTICTCVPRVFEKIKLKMLSKASPLQKKIILFASWTGCQYKLRNKKLLFPIYQLMNLLVYRKVKQKMGGRINFFISGGAPLVREIAEFFYGLGILIIEGYGLTETSPVICCNTPASFKFGTVGKPIPGLEVRIAEDGEICVRGKSVMMGYFKNDEATQEVIRDGWFYTGDIGEFDADGFLKITDRKKDLIKTSGGKMVAPQRIENLIKDSPYINQIVVCGDKRKFLTALVVPNYEALTDVMVSRGIHVTDRKSLTRDSRAINFIKDEIDAKTVQLAHYEKIQYIALLDNDFTQENGELTPTLKVKRRLIQERFKTILDKLYALAEKN